jgi:hypothetical protein
MEKFPKIGDIVIYRYGSHDRGINQWALGRERPAIVVSVWPNEYGPNVPGVNLQVFTDGSNDLFNVVNQTASPTVWVTSRAEGTTPGTWSWPVDSTTPIPSAQ